MGPREVLNKLRWSGTNELQNVKITILHRGAPGDKRVIEGAEILELGRGFMRVASPDEEVYIPYHRILKIEAGGRAVWEKRVE